MHISFTCFMRDKKKGGGVFTTRNDVIFLPFLCVPCLPLALKMVSSTGLLTFSSCVYFPPAFVHQSFPFRPLSPSPSPRSSAILRTIGVKLRCSCG